MKAVLDGFLNHNNKAMSSADLNEVVKDYMARAKGLYNKSASGQAINAASPAQQRAYRLIANGGRSDLARVPDVTLRRGIIGSLDAPPERGVNRILNIGDSHPVGLMTMIETLEEAIGRKAEKIMRPMQPGDVTATYADVSKLNALTGYQPKVMLKEGLGRFADWYRDYYKR